MAAPHPAIGTPAEFSAYVTADLAKWTRLAKEANLKIE
jgi:tripartite-type tricarboxylate transporter receptor subunit TctC